MGQTSGDRQASNLSRPEDTIAMVTGGRGLAAASRTSHLAIEMECELQNCRPWHGVVPIPARPIRRIAPLQHMADVGARRRLEQYPCALTHEHRSNSLFARAIHRFGDSTKTDRALAGGSKIAARPLLVRRVTRRGFFLVRPSQLALHTALSLAPADVAHRLKLRRPRP